MSGEKVAALRQRYRMRICPPDIAERYLGRRDQVVLNAQAELAVHKDAARKQQIEVLGDRTRQRILDRNHGCCCFAAVQGIENIG